MQQTDPPHLMFNRLCLLVLRLPFDQLGADALGAEALVLGHEEEELVGFVTETRVVVPELVQELGEDEGLGVAWLQLEGLRGFQGLLEEGEAPLVYLDDLVVEGVGGGGKG